MAKRVPAVSYMVLLICGVLLYWIILEHQQRKFFLRQRHIFTQRAEADVEDEIDNFFQLESYLLWKMYISISFMFEELSKLCILFPSS